MKAHELIKLLNDGALSKYSELYSDVERAKDRFITAINEFTKTYGNDKDISLFSVPSRFCIRLTTDAAYSSNSPFLPMKIVTYS